MKGHRIAVTNPAAEARGGMVVVSGHLPFDEVEAFDAGGRPLRAQIDRSDPGDRSRDELALFFDRPLPPGISVVDVVEAKAPPLPPAVRAEVHPIGVKMATPSMWLWLQTEPRLGHRSWFGGAVTSVVLHDFEILDSFASSFAWEGHDPEKRAMQIDRVRFSADQEHALFREPWRVLSTTSGPVRATATIASAPFDVELLDRRIPCSLHRRLGVSAESDVVLDEVWLSVPSTFSVGYFMQAQFGLWPALFPNQRAWFTITSDVPPRPGYGFATDALVGWLRNPPHDYPDERTAHRAFAWEIGPARTARSLHLFRLWTGRDAIGDATGRAWYDLLFQPLRASWLP